MNYISNKNKEIVLITNCIDCNKEKYYNKYDIKRNRHLKLRCRSCSLKYTISLKSKKTEENKKIYQKQYYINNKNKLNKFNTLWRSNKRKEVIKLLGGKCISCGETDYVVLDIDHINNDGAIERKLTKGKNAIHYDINNNKYQLLCKNCNWRKEYYKRKYDAIQS